MPFKPLESPLQDNSAFNYLNFNYTEDVDVNVALADYYSAADAVRLRRANEYYARKQDPTLSLSSPLDPILEETTNTLDEALDQFQIEVPFYNPSHGGRV